MTVPEIVDGASAPSRGEVAKDLGGPALAALILSVTIVVAAVASLNVALPSLASDLNATQTQLQWMVDAYPLVFAALLLPFGALGDRYGRRRLLLVGLAVFTTSSAVGVFAQSPSTVIVVRVIAASGAAMIFPATLSTITATVSPARRASAIGMWSAATAIGGVIGLVGSGLLIEAFWWGSIFVATTALAGVVLVIAATTVPDSSDPAHATVDLVGALVSILAIGGLVVGVTEGPLHGWASGQAAGPIVVGVVALGAFIVRELRAAQPLLDVRVLSDRRMAAGSLTIFVVFFTTFGFFFLAVQYLADVLDFGPLRSSVGLLVMAIALGPASTAAPRLAARIGRERTSLMGLILVAAGFGVLTTLDTSSSYWLFAALSAVLGAGIGFAQTPATETIVSALPTHKQGVASALNDVLRELGGALGIAVLGSVFSARYRDEIAAAIAERSNLEALRSSPAVLPVLSDSPELRDVVQIGRAAFMEGWAAATTLGAVIASVAVVAVILARPQGTAPAS